MLWGLRCGGPLNIQQLTTLNLFKVFVEPAEELPVPHERVLGLEDLMCLILEGYELGGYALQFCCRKCLEALGEGDAEVELAGEDEDGGGRESP